MLHLPASLAVGMSQVMPQKILAHHSQIQELALLGVLKGHQARALLDGHKLDLENGPGGVQGITQTGPL